MKEIVFIDTNIVNSDAPNLLFGGQGIIEQLLEIVEEIIVPQVVIDELCEHKKVAFSRSRARVIKQLENTDFEEIADQLQSIDYEDIIFQSLLKKLPKGVSILDMPSGKDFFRWAYPKAIGHDAPFEKESDRGFKDAIIAFSIEQYVAANQDVTIVLMCNDHRLAEYFLDNDHVQVFSELADCKKFIETKTSERKSIDHMLITLKESSSFALTHKAIEDLANIKEKLNLADKVDIIQSTVQNNQIYSIYNDPDIEEFIAPIFGECKDILNNELYNDFILKTRLVEKGYSLRTTLVDDMS